MQPLRYPFRALALASALGALAMVVATGNAPCTFAWLTGLPCPSCGSGRSVRALLHGDLDTAWQVNPLGIPAALVLFFAAVSAVVLTWQSGTPRALGTARRGRLLAGAAVLVVVLEVVLWVLRFMGMLGRPVPV